MINVLLADDHKMFIDGVKSILNGDENITVVGAAQNGEEVLSIMREQTVEVAI